ncbi:uncharacterized protein TM35_000074920 [Trypanosoma theileri]|uniref:Uncharacterized protein n=1 Tax=Trypanosoma theileri TaxID=67003 RepID=A0A1X0P2L4_9TRYP|nr:uncharacterized protein TM35_000074920 [Trypanosoma theileri]ORC91068.1 hypothetical protein TM35_000074920 [Trypanosoma theileri]
MDCSSRRKRRIRVKVVNQQLFKRDCFYDNQRHGSLYDMAHVNAVREHYALRRDLLLTPKWQSDLERNAANEHVWVENRNLMNTPVPETSVDTNFTALVRRRAEQHDAVNRVTFQTNQK